MANRHRILVYMIGVETFKGVVQLSGIVDSAQNVKKQEMLPVALRASNR